MTQIVVALTPSRIFAAVDRRGSYKRSDGKWEMANEELCKAVSLNMIHGILYTGIAQIGDTPTNIWLARILARNQVNGPYDAIPLIASRSTRVISQIGKKDSRHHSFIMVGWLFDKLNNVNVPYCATISNALGTSQKWLKEANYKFEARMIILKHGAQGILSSFGVDLENGRRNKLGESLTNSLRCGDMEAAQLAIVREIQLTNSTAESGSVGGNVLTFTLPSPKASADHLFMLNGSPSPEAATFLSFDPEVDSLRQHGPTIVAGGWAYETLCETDDSIEYQSVTTKLIYVPR